MSCNTITHAHVQQQQLLVMNGSSDLLLTYSSSVVFHNDLLLTYSSSVVFHNDLLLT